MNIKGPVASCSQKINDLIFLWNILIHFNNCFEVFFNLKKSYSQIYFKLTKK